ncbi:hypothetical protein E5F05_13475 [Deinococcus metallilatus]|uniref:Tetratricopeptide (TPR) repeat protein n=1 Tax=Deinococcus metallilatus TaxID=1211322 RepID=A0AAJ5F3B9_9DEIO|nr:hypothetical protein [Deinococcus metallilatus]MBB5294074.1 tetratricopeptide (TPR) repeat protein [Deinococcus metallilatus]QBY08861.1 hypothetical protein E5F05_13475 [Deinococcus metallilatus]RXJ10005.1 hypothetical protein ERJ73_12305 [Deinococcus metallilatus]TLK28058.1 hypothetical protein FCS05_09075 [Deinococcus metallilatus]GMA16590.1 hypothetical protein GCM10025871_29210 [Deinococcus metallilatus]
MTEPSGLHFHTRSGLLTLHGQTLDLDVRQQRLLAVVAVATLRGKGGAEVSEFRRARGWSHLNDGAIKNAASRLLMRLGELRAPLVAFAPREKTKRWALNMAEIGALSHDLADLETFAAWVFDEAAPMQSDTLNAARLLVLAATAFEQGRYRDAEEHARAAFLAEPSPDQHLRALAMIAWVKTVSASHEEGWSTVKALQEQLQRYQQDAATLPSDEVEALTWIQIARFHMRKVQPKPARAAYAHAARLLGEGHHREWGAIEAGLGYLAQQDGELMEAARRYQSALGHFTRGHWPWAMHAQYNNLAAVNFRLHEEGVPDAPHHAPGFLAEAIRWSLHARDFADSMDFGGSIDIEVNLAYAYRLQGRIDEARKELLRAARSARASQNISDRAIITVERAEIEEASGQRAQAVESLREALGLLSEVGVDEWTRAAERRLNELEEGVPLSKPIKLW